MMADGDLDRSATPSGEPRQQPQIVTREDGATIAYHRLAGKSPGIVFLGGFMSDMTGTKATALEAFCRARGQAFLRFDYFGHGASSGAFAAATIGRWREECLGLLARLTQGPHALLRATRRGWPPPLSPPARPRPLP